MRRSLQVRLAVWYAAASGVVLALLALFIYGTIEHRLRGEIDRQLHTDLQRRVSQLHEEDDWLQGTKDEGDDQALGWFEVWSADKRLLLRHWPVREGKMSKPLPPPSGAQARFQTVALKGDRLARVLEAPRRLGTRRIFIRVFYDQTEMRRVLRETAEAFLLALPLTVLLCSMGGYWIAGRSLRPLAVMAAHARKIGSESLSERLPNPNPHDELGQLASVFNETLGRLESSFAELRRFTADASHELRTPLTALRAVGEVTLSQAETQDDWRECVGSMLEESQRLNDLIESLLTLARMDSGKVAIQAENVRLGEVAEDVCASLAVVAAEKEQHIDLTGEPALAASADPLLLRQALMNIVHNALRYAPANTHVIVRIASRDSRAVIEVSDQGPGIASEHLPRLFDRFYRVDKARSRAEGGHGLGLSIAKWSVERMGGQVEVESQVGAGSVFRIILPS